MKAGKNRILLCLLAAVLAASTGSTPVRAADGAPAVTQEESAEEEAPAARLSESREDVELTADQAEKMLVKTGSIEGFDVYTAGKAAEEKIWKAHGGKPDKKAELTDRQKEEKKAAEAEIKEMKRLGELVIVDRDTGLAAAAFSKSVKCEEGVRFISDGERYLLTADKDSTRPLRLTEVVSTVDDPRLFRTSDGDTLELMSADFRDVLAVYKKDGTEDGKLVYRSPDAGFAWLSLSGREVIGTYRYAAENDRFRMLVDDRLANIGIENKETGYIWWSSPLRASRDSLATPLIVGELRSSAVLRYGIPEKRNNNNYLRSGSADDCRVTVKDIKNGIRAEYDYYKAGISFPVEYTLEGDPLRASLKTDSIIESEPANTATEISLLGSFGAASQKEEGYFVIPDGCGALVRFNNGRVKDSTAYSQPVYGSDITAVPTSKGAVTEQIYLPVYGIVKEDNALLAVAAGGDSNARLSVRISGQSGSGYNLCGFTFVLRGTDTYYMSGKLSDKITVFENGSIRSGDIDMLYYPVTGRDIGYADLAERYRQYLSEDAGVSSRENSAPLHIALYGGALKKKPVFGVPVTMKQSVTSYSQAQKILSGLVGKGAEDMIVSYDNWNDDGIGCRVDTGSSPSGTLGGRDALDSLMDYADENGIELYPVSDSCVYLPGGGYSAFSGSAVRISGSYSRIVSYDRAYGIPDGFRKNMSLLSPEKFGEVLGKSGSSISAAGFGGICPGRLTSVLYGDYSKSPVSRDRAMELQCSSLESLDRELDILADTANAYAFPYVSCITGVPMTSSRFDIFDEDVPFLQLVLRGLIPCYTGAVNGSPDPESLLLRAASLGMGISFDMTYSETGVLKDTEYDRLYYSDYSSWSDTAAVGYRFLQPLLSEVSGQTITDYTAENGGRRIITEYSGGTEVITDLDERTVEFGGRKLLLEDFEEEGGIRLKWKKSE